MTENVPTLRGESSLRQNSKWNVPRFSQWNKSHSRFSEGRRMSPSSLPQLELSSRYWSYNCSREELGLEEVFLFLDKWPFRFAPSHDFVHIWSRWTTFESPSTYRTCTVNPAPQSRILLPFSQYPFRENNAYAYVVLLATTGFDLILRFVVYRTRVCELMVKQKVHRLYCALDCICGKFPSYFPLTLEL